MEICRKFVSMQPERGGWRICADCADIFVIFVTEEIVRIRASFDRALTEESYVLMTTAWEDRLDPFFAGERNRVEPACPEIRETETELTFSTSAVTLTVQKDPLSFRLTDREGTLLFSDLAGNPYTLDSNRRLTHYCHMEEGDCFYGFGEKGGALNKNMCFIRQRATDSMGYDPQKTDTLYKHIPFYIRLDRASKKAVGLFYHNFHESVFNMGCEKGNYWPRYTYFQTDGGDIDLFLLAGSTLPRILDNYTLLTGRPMLLPKRALGYQGSSMFYAELEADSDDAVLGFADTVREQGFPLDGFHLSSGYTAQNGKRCVFTWNSKRFKDPKAFFAAMNDRGAQVVPNIKPGILTSHPRFAQWEAANAFVRDSKEPNRPAVGRWWGGPGVFWDFTNPAARDLWKEALTESLLETGTDSVWNDNCEYDSLMDKDAQCCFDGTGGTVGALKPIMSTLMCRLSNEAVREHRPNARPYTVCRSGSAGIQHYAQTWAGDNYTSWDSLKYNIPTILGMGLSGQPNEGADIGGFAGPAPDEELFVRWVQQGIFQPRFSIHSASSDNTVTEPWMFRRSTERIRQAIRLRYRLAPTLYSCEYEASQSGAPIMRPLVYEFQQDPAVWENSFDYLFGRDLLVANVLESGAKERAVYLPAGCRWFDLNNDYACWEGGQTITVPVMLDTIPMFLREGGCLALADNERQRMTDPVTDLRLLIAPKGTVTTTLYEDDGVSNDYLQGGFRKTAVTVTQGQLTTVSFASEGSFPDPAERITLEVIAREKCPFWVQVDGQKLESFRLREKFEAAESGWYYSHTRRTVEIRYPNPKRDHTVTVSFEQFDLIGM